MRLSGRKKTTEVFAAETTHQIALELQYLNIGIDELFNYTEEKPRRAIQKIGNDVEKLFCERLTRAGTRCPYDPSGKPVGGNWISGSCPHCLQKMKGYACDACSIPLAPAQIVDAQSVTGEPLDWRDVELKFVRIDTAAATEYLRALPLLEEHRAIAAGRLASGVSDVQWSNIDAWGLDLGDQSMLYNRNTPFVEQIMLGDLAKPLLGIDVNAFEKNSGVITVLAFGKDNAGHFLVDIPAFAFATRKYEPYKLQWVSPFYGLNGSKMSTGRKHAIWVKDLMAAGTSADAIRMYMCHKFAMTDDVDLSTSELAQYEQKYALIEGTLLELEVSVGQHTAPDTHLIVALEKLRQLIREEMHETSPNIFVYSVVLTHLLDVLSQLPVEQHTNWMEGFCSVMEPMLPDMCTAIQQRLSGRKS